MMRFLIRMYRAFPLRPHCHGIAGQHSALCYVVSAFYPLNCDVKVPRPPMPEK